MNYQVERQLHASALALFNHEPAGVHGVAKSRVTAPAFDLLHTRPGFSPHDQTTTEKGDRGSFFFHWQHIFETNPFHSTVIEVMRDLLIGQGFDLTKAPNGHPERWETWMRDANFIEDASMILESLFKMGSAAALMVRGPDIAGTGVMDLRLQVLSVRGLFPVWNEDRSDWIGFNYWPQDHRSEFEMKVGHGFFIPREDLLFWTVNRQPGMVLGRAINYQALNEYIGLKDLHRVLGVIASRQTHRFVHWSVDTKNLTEINEKDNTDPDVRKDSPADQRLKAVRAVVEDRVIISADGETEVVDNIITDDRVTANDLTGTADLAGMVAGIDAMKNAVDRKARIPPVFLANPGDSNRATSYNELIVFTVMMKGHTRNFFRPLEAQLMPELRLGGELIAEEEIIQEDEAVKAEMVRTILELWESGLLGEQEAREILERMLNIGLQTATTPEPREPTPA